MNWRVSAVAWCACFAVLGCLIALAASVMPTAPPALRALPALVVTLFVPGYLALGLLFPRVGDLEALPRSTLSVLLSVAFTAIAALILSYTGLGISRPSVVVSLVVVSAAMAVALVFQQRRLDAKSRLFHTLLLQPGLPEIRAVIVALTMLPLVALGAGITLHTRPSPGSTELFVEQRPDASTTFKGPAVTIVIVNREPDTARFVLELAYEARPVARSAEFALSPGQTRKWELRFAPLFWPDAVPVNVYLLKQGATTPYRQLTLWLYEPPRRTPGDPS